MQGRRLRWGWEEGGGSWDGPSEVSQGGAALHGQDPGCGLPQAGVL